MNTAIELAKDGTRTVFHRRGLKAWTHPYDDPYMMDFDNEFRRGVPVKLACPGCRQVPRSAPSKAPYSALEVQLTA